MKTGSFVFPNHTGYLPGEQTAILARSDAANMFDVPVAEPFALTVGRKTYEVVPWGVANDFPQQIIEKVEASPDLSSGLLFNVQVTYGDGVLPCKIRYKEDGQREVIPVNDNEEINKFFEYNDINGYLLEQLTDISYFYNVFPEIILNRRIGKERKVVELNHKEAAFSRWTEVDKKTGKIEHHLYYSDWQGNTVDEDPVVTPVLDARRPLFDLLERMGRRKNKRGIYVDEQKFRYIVPVSFPTPGRTYYQRPYWYSIIESGWYDFAVAIPEFKKYVLNNGMTIKYIIYLDEDYFPDIFAREGITEQAAKETRIKEEFDNMNSYLTEMKNQGKSMVSFTKTSPDGKKNYRIEVKKVENDLKGGEYLEDSSEVSNMIAYSLGVHPSLIGAAPGKTGGSMSGTDKRELFIIKQALLKPIRDRLLRPLYLIKNINGWDPEIQFTIPNLQLTTLDKNKTGTEEKA